jgi:hypothetical protein
VFVVALLTNNVILYELNEYVSLISFEISWLFYEVIFCKEQVSLEVFEQI